MSNAAGQKIQAHSIGSNRFGATPPARANNWIARHVGAADGSPTGLLWVRQEVLGLEPADARPAEKDRLAEVPRDLLSSVAGEIAQVSGGRTTDRIIRRCQQDLDALASGSRLSPGGAWKEAVDAAKGLEAELDVLERQCSDLSDALIERRTTETELQRLAEPEAKARRVSEAESASKTLDGADQLNSKRLGSLKGARDAEGALRTVLEDAAQETTRLRSLIVASSVRMHVEYFGDTRLFLAGAEITCGGPDRRGPAVR